LQTLRSEHLFRSQYLIAGWQKPANGPDKPCSPCRASDELVLTVSTALATFLNDRFSPRDWDDSPLFAGDSPVRTEIAEAGRHLVQGSSDWSSWWLAGGCT
jgi:hypothetical protein